MLDKILSVFGLMTESRVIHLRKQVAVLQEAVKIQAAEIQGLNRRNYALERWLGIRGKGPGVQA